MSKKNIVLIVVLIVLAFCFYKIFNIKYYKVGDPSAKPYVAFRDDFLIAKDLEVKHSPLLDDEYIAIANIKMKNITGNMTEKKMEDNVFASYVMPVSGGRTAVFMVGEGVNYVEMLKMQKEIFADENKTPSNQISNAFFEKNKIKNDLDLMKYLKRDLNYKAGLFTPVKYIKERYSVYNMSSIMIPPYLRVIPLTGDYRGIMSELSYGYEINLEQDGKKYAFIFVNKDVFNEEFIKDFISSIIIE